MKAIPALALAFLVAGCSTQPRQPDWHWAKVGATDSDFNADNGQCRAQAFAVPGVSLLQAVLVLDGCMHGKGWHKATAQQPRAAAPLSYYPAGSASPKRGCDLTTNSDGSHRLICP